MAQIEETINVDLSEPQTAVLEARKQVILEMAGQGGGKSQNIGYSTGMLIGDYPEARGFIAANTQTQLSQSTLTRVFETWKKIYGFTEYDKKSNPGGAFVVDKRPPLHFKIFTKPRNYNGIISFWNGAAVYIGSLENYKAHDGKEFAWAHLDETKDTKEEALKDVILGRLRQYGLWYDKTRALHWDTEINPDEAAAKGWEPWTPLYIHTSPALGGVDWLNKMFKLEKFANEIKEAVQVGAADYFYKEFENKAVCIYSAYHNEHNLRAGFLQDQAANLESEDAILKLIHGYPFSKTGGEYFPNFRRDRHVGNVSFIPGLSVSTSWDFNVSPYMTCLLIQTENVTRFLDEIGKKHETPALDRTPIDVIKIRVYREYCFKNPKNTVEAIGYQFNAEHDPALTDVFYYGDSQGLNRIEGLNRTRYSYVEDALAPFLHNSSKKVRNPNVKALQRRDLVNGIFAGRWPGVEIEIDSSCTELITDLEQVKEGRDGKIKPKHHDRITGQSWELLGHTSDALEYFVSEAFKYLLNSK